MKQAGSVILAIAMIVAGAAQASAQTPAGTEWEPNGGRAKAYINSLIGPGALLGIGLGATVDHLREDPTEWEQDAGGFGKRFASGAGRNAVQETVRHGLAAALHVSTSYQSCSCAAVGRRVGHAFVETITVRNREGERMIAIPRFVGVYAGAFAEQQWRPGRSDLEVVSTAGSAIAFGFVSNLWREFVGWPK